MKVESLAPLAALAVTLAASAASADQLAWNERDVSERGAKAIKPGSLLVSYCSLCDGERVEVWQVKKVVVSATSTKGLYEVGVFGKRLSRSVKAFDAGEYDEPVQYAAFPPDEQSGWFLESIDLAYVYVPVDGRTFRCLGRVLRLECDVKVEKILLPDDAMMPSVDRNAVAGDIEAMLPMPEAEAAGQSLNTQGP